MGSDLSVVNAARVSFSKQSSWEYPFEDADESLRQLSKADQGLIAFLARGCTTGDWKSMMDLVEMYVDKGDSEGLKKHVDEIRRMPKHWTPFAHTAITIHVKVPIFVARQLGKHQVGFVQNEVSRRYVTDTPEFFIPEWRKAAANVKQGSSDELAIVPEFDKHWVDYQGGFIDMGYGEGFVELAVDFYNHLLDSGVCPEQARMVLPQNMYTEWYWTSNLYGIAEMYNTRTEGHTQKETRDVVGQLDAIMRPLFPVSWKELTR